MADPLEIELLIVDPVYLDLDVAPSVFIGTVLTGPQGPAGNPWIPMTGAKSSASDAGLFGEISIDNDYLYVCVQSGEAGSAIWKKSLMFQT